MAVQQHLSRAPVTEAVIDVRVTLPPDIDFERISHTFEVPEFGYVRKGIVVTGAWGFSISVTAEAVESPPAQGSAKRVGIRLHSPDDKYVAVFTTEGFTLSRLEPYQSWPKLLDEAKRMWDYYSRHLNPTSIVRAATRYINNLRLPMQHGDEFGNYVNALIELPAALPQAIEGFLQRFVMFDQESQARVILNIAWDGGRTSPEVPVILDIDVQTEQGLQDMGDGLWQRMAVLRDLKNRCFFGAIKDAAVELYV